MRPDLDVLFLTGDFIGHFNNNKRGRKYDPKKYENLMRIHQNISNIITEVMPNTIVIPTFGNNDFDIDDEPANETTKKEFYNRIFNMWFVEHPKNSKLMNLT